MTKSPQSEDDYVGWVISSINSLSTQIAIICWANAGLLSAVLLAQRRQMTLARCHFAQNPPLVRSWSSNSTSTVETLVLVQCWANVSTPTTCCQQLQPLPNVGPTIACYLGMHCIVFKTFIEWICKSREFDVIYVHSYYM